MTYEQKMEFLSRCRPEKKDDLLLRIFNGEQVDITTDEDLFFQVNKDRVSLSEFTERDKFKHSAEDFKQKKKFMDPSGVTKNKHFRLIGEIPPEIYFSRPEFSPLLPKEERDRNIRSWLNQFNTFRVGDKQV